MTTGTASPGLRPSSSSWSSWFSLWRPASPPDAVSMPAEAARPRMETAGLTAWYGSTAALPGVGSSFAPHQVPALIGPSGCGKSTLLRSLNRMHEETPGARVEGSVLLDGQDVYGSRVDLRRLRRLVGMVFQRPTVSPPMSISDNVAAGLRLDRLAGPKLDEAVERALTRAGLWGGAKDRRSEEQTSEPQA